MDIKVTIDSGFDLSDINIEEAIQTELDKSAHKIERDAKIACPIDTGNLRRSITTEMGALEANIGSNCELIAAPLCRNAY